MQQFIFALNLIISFHVFENVGESNSKSRKKKEEEKKSLLRLGLKAQWKKVSVFKSALFLLFAVVCCLLFVVVCCCCCCCCCLLFAVVVFSPSSQSNKPRPSEAIAHKYCCKNTHKIKEQKRNTHTHTHTHK